MTTFRPKIYPWTANSLGREVVELLATIVCFSVFISSNRSALWVQTPSVDTLPDHGADGTMHEDPVLECF